MRCICSRIDGDVAVGDLARVAALADRRVLGRQAEGVVAHRAQYPVAVTPAEVGDDIAQRVVLHVPHVELARGVREHLEHVRLALVHGGRVVRVRDVEGLGVGPDPLPLRLDRLWVVPLHVRLLKRKSLSIERPWEAGAAFAAFASCAREEAPSARCLDCSSARQRAYSDFPVPAVGARLRVVLAALRSSHFRHGPATDRQHFPD